MIARSGHQKNQFEILFIKSVKLKSEFDATLDQNFDFYHVGRVHFPQPNGLS